jgi:hypothetical protein
VPQLTAAPQEIQPASKPGPRVYNGEKDMWDAMLITLKARKVPPELWPKVNEAMMGKIGKDFKKVTDEIVLAHEASSEIQKIPF